MNLYEMLANDVEQQVRLGVLRPGERIPSVRQLSKHLGVSVTTVVRGYLLLESRGLIEGRPQSGYFVRGSHAAPSVSALNPPRRNGEHVDVSAFVMSALRSIRDTDGIPFGAPYVDPRLLESRKIVRYTDALARRAPDLDPLDILPPGHPDLIRLIARRYLENGLPVDPAEIVITLGATEAINLCLQAVARPGATIAVERPTFYVILQAIERLGMRALEIPHRAGGGFDTGALVKLVKDQSIAACILMPNFQNPTGNDIPDKQKKELVDLMAQRDVPLIEDAVYNDIYFGDRHPQSF